MSHAIDQREMNKEQPEILWEVGDQSVHDDRVAVVDVNELISAGWLGDLTKFFLANIHYGLQTRGMSKIEDIGSYCIASFRDVIVPIHTMFGWTFPGQHRRVSDQGDAWMHGLC